MDQNIKLNNEDDLIDNCQSEFIKILQELQIKGQQLEEYRNQMTENILKQHELEHKLKNEKRKNNNDEFNNILMKNGNDALESERQRVTKELAVYKCRNDMIVLERDSLYAEARVQALANLKLKETLKDLERKHQCHLLFQNEVKEKLEKTVSAFKAIMPTIIILQQKQENILEMYDDMNKFETLKLAVKQIEKLKDEAVKKCDFFENKFITEKAECLKLRELLNNLSIRQIHEESKLTTFWKEQAIYLQTQLKHEKERNESMEETLGIAIENEKNCRKPYNKNEYSEVEKYVEGHINKILKDVELQTDD